MKSTRTVSGLLFVLAIAASVSAATVVSATVPLRSTSTPSPLPSPMPTRTPAPTATPTFNPSTGQSHVAVPSVSEADAPDQCGQFMDTSNQANQCQPALTAGKLILGWSFSPTACPAEADCIAKVDGFNVFESTSGVGGAYISVSQNTEDPAKNTFAVFGARTAYIGDCFKVQAYSGIISGDLSRAYCVTKDGPDPLTTPTNLRAVQNASDCGSLPGLLPLACGNALSSGQLDLIWDDPSKDLVSYDVFRVDNGHHDLLTKIVASTINANTVAAWFAVPKPSGNGYLNECFAVDATIKHAGLHTTAESTKYCYTSGSLATTQTLSVVEAGSLFNWSMFSPNPPGCSQTFVQSAVSSYGSPFGSYFPGIANSLTGYDDWGFGPGVELIVGSEWAFPTALQSSACSWYSNDPGPASTSSISSMCTPSAYTTPSPHCASLIANDPINLKGTYRLTIQPVQANSSAAFLFDLTRLHGHRIYSASLSFPPNGSGLIFSNGQFQTVQSNWCPTSLRVSTTTNWWNHTSPTLFPAGAVIRDMTALPLGVDVTGQIAAWAAGSVQANKGFVLQSDIGSQTQISKDNPGNIPYAFFSASIAKTLNPAGGCVMSTNAPKLLVTYF